MAQNNIQEIAQQIKSINVMYSRFKVVYDGINDLVLQSSISGVPIGGSVVAPSGLGKNHLITVFERKHAQNTDLLDSSTAVVTISAPSSPNSGALIDRMLQILGHPIGVRTTKNQDLRQAILVQGLKDRGVQMLIINEFQHVFRGKRTVSASEITDLLKEIMDDTKIPIFVMGTDELGDLHHLDTQFASRLPARFQIRPFSKGEEWKGFINAFQKQCSLIDISILDKLANLLHKATEGSPRTLKHLILAAVSDAHSKNQHVVDKSHFCTAFTKIFGPATTEPNPFG
jgi:type II secretory pathway predicted ATPase ExeA